MLSSDVDATDDRPQRARQSDSASAPTGSSHGSGASLATAGNSSRARAVVTRVGRKGLETLTLARHGKEFGNLCQLASMGAWSAQVGSNPLGVTRHEPVSTVNGSLPGSPGRFDAEAQGSDLGRRHTPHVGGWQHSTGIPDGRPSNNRRLGCSRIAAMTNGRTRKVCA